MSVFLAAGTLLANLYVAYYLSKVHNEALAPMERRIAAERLRRLAAARMKEDDMGFWESAGNFLAGLGDAPAAIETAVQATGPLAPVVAPAAPLALPGAGPLAAATAGGMPRPQAGAPPAAGQRGRIMTMVVRQHPNGFVEPVKITRGGVALYRNDMVAFERVRRVARKIRKALPRTRYIKVKASGAHKHKKK